MKTLLSTTALMIVLGLPTLSVAQTAQTDTKQTDSAQTDSAQTGTAQTGTADAPKTADAEEMQSEAPGFLAMRGQSDVFASELIGHDVYARRSATGATATGTTTTTTTTTTGTAAGAMKADGSHSMSTMQRTDLDAMDNIGQITEIVLSSNGQVRAIVISIGGFLGMGEHDVAVTMDQVTFSSDADDRSEMYIVVDTGADMLKASPRYERTAMTGDTAANAMGNTTDTTAGTTAANPTDRTAFVAPTIERDGYNQVVVTDVSSEMLIGAEVYGVNDESVGSIDELIVDDKGVITNVIVDFGGFLGLGTSQVQVGFDELTVLANDGRNDVRVYIDATKEQIQAQPQYRPAN
jgi:hypothetical protein